MARGRMIDNEIARDKNVNDLSDAWSMLAFTWLISFLDREGRTYGDPAIIRSMVFPRRIDVTVEQMESYITEWASKGMVIWYEAKGDKWIFFPNFEEHQIGLRKDREPESVIPKYDVDTCRIIAGCLPDKIPVKLIEGNRREENGREEKGPADLFSLTQHTIETITGIMPDREASSAINELIEMHATDEDIKAGYTWIMTNGKKRFTYYGQLIGPTRTALSIRLGKNGNGAKVLIGTDVNGDPVYE
jgi:hypothetical protein